jgi:hypothetical protein
MWPAAPPRSICSPADALLASALFVSTLQCSDELSTGQIQQAIAAAVRAFGSAGCAGRVAQEFGDHPDTAPARMRWARSVAAGASSVLPAGASSVLSVGASSVLSAVASSVLSAAA